MTDLQKVIDNIGRYAGDLEYAASDLEREVERLNSKLEEIEINENTNAKLYDLIKRLYIAKISLPQHQFDAELKSFFLNTIDKRL
jgi:hypothetical protein